ncbi:MAG: hypothetical protein KAR07_08005 [Spirochaetes bacterium]|nr:hypothetical protein [Spirochaetota bacterium]
MPQKNAILSPEELARYFYKFPINAFPILDDSFNFSGLLLKRYILNNMDEFKAIKTNIKSIINKYIYYPNEGEIVRMIFGDKKIQEFPVFNRKGYLIGVWDLSSFFRIFDKVPFSAFLNFKNIFDNYHIPILITNDGKKIISFNKSMSKLSGLDQKDNTIIGRSLDRVFSDLDWEMIEKAGQKVKIKTPLCDLSAELSSQVMENNKTLNIISIINYENNQLIKKSKKADNAGTPLNEAIDKLERELIISAMMDCKGNVSKTSELLEIPRQTLQYKLIKYKIKPEIFY